MRESSLLEDILRLTLTLLLGLLIGLAPWASALSQELATWLDVRSYQLHLAQSPTQPSYLPSLPRSSWWDDVVESLSTEEEEDDRIEPELVCTSLLLSQRIQVRACQGFQATVDLQALRGLFPGWWSPLRC